MEVDPVAEVGPSGVAAENETLQAGDYYSDSYSHFGIHEEMLKDEVRTRTYQQAIMRNKDQFKGKTVLDVGCGTGILCMFAAQAGAAKVIGVDFSGIIEQAKVIVKKNGFADRISLIRGKLEEVDLGVDKVDIIVSEWMGYNLFYESMLDTVLYARDKWLVPGGLILPDKATLYITAIEDAEYKQEKIHWWDNVYGFDMSCIKDIAMKEPLVDIVDENQIISDHCPLHTVDIRTCKIDDLTFMVPFKLKFALDMHCHAFVTWFDVEFSGLDNPCTLPTGPQHRSTHWKQTVYYTEESSIPASENDTVQGTYECVPNGKNHRDLDVHLTYQFEGQLASVKGDTHYKIR